MEKAIPAPIDIEGNSKKIAKLLADKVFADLDNIPHDFLYALNDKFADAINSEIILKAIHLLPDILEAKLKKKD